MRAPRLTAEHPNATLPSSQPSLADMAGKTALHIASIAGREDILRTLLKKTKQIDVRDGDGGTALHYAVLHGNEEAVKLLLDHGANVTLKK